jgi:hypothetical protein
MSQVPWHYDTAVPQPFDIMNIKKLLFGQTTFVKVYKGVAEYCRAVRFAAIEFSKESCELDETEAANLADFVMLYEVVSEILIGLETNLSPDLTKSSISEVKLAKIGDKPERGPFLMFTPTQAQSWEPQMITSKGYTRPESDFIKFIVEKPGFDVVSLGPVDRQCGHPVRHADTLVLHGVTVRIRNVYVSDPTESKQNTCKLVYDINIVRNLTIWIIRVYAYQI